jgi:hypothetical protein
MSPAVLFLENYDIESYWQQDSSAFAFMMLLIPNPIQKWLSAAVSPEH